VRALRAANTKADLMAAYLSLLRATGDPVMVVSPTALSSTIYQDSTETQFLSVSNPGTLNADLIFTITENPSVSWLTVTPAADTVLANGTSPITVTFDATGLPPGTVATDLIVAGNDPANPADTVSVTLNVLGIPQISVTPDSLFFAVAPFDSAQDSVTVSNLGVGDLNYTLSLTGTSGADRLEFASTASPSTGGGRYRGNVYQVDVSIPLKQIDAYLSISNATELEFFVYENSTATGTYTKIFSTTVTSGTGAGWHSSGPIDVPLEAGKFYFIGTGWLGTVTYYNGGIVSLPQQVPFGYVLGPSGSNSYPPPASRLIPGGGSIIWSQALEYGVPANVSILSPLSGTVPPSGSTVVSLEVVGGPDPGTFGADLHIQSNDPNIADFIVPITIEVSDLTPAPVQVALPTVLALHPNSPNPFRAGSGTVIRYDLPEAGPVSLRIYDVTGRLVATLRNGHEEAGFRSVRWDGRGGDGLRVASGVYFYVLETRGETLRRKMVFLR
jgi:hypothetical protein